MRRFTLVTVVTVALATAPAGALAARNPSGTGPPSQSCQEIEAAGGKTPGHAANSPGSPFNEPGINSESGGTGGQHYSEKSQYDVACYQVSPH
ncbi:MAG: adenylate cyclase [Solirubrobacterales bacterium]